MKFSLMRQIFATITVVLSLASNYAFALDNAHDFVWVVALEKGFSNEVCSEWNPTLYKISVKEARVVEKKKIAEQGAPIFCYSLPGDKIRVILNEGIAANGTYVDKRTTIDITIDKNSMRILESKKKEGCNNYQEYKNVAPSGKKSLGVDKPKQFVKREGDRFLGTSTSLSRLFMLKNYGIKNRRDLSLTILDLKSLKEIGSISLNPGDRNLGLFSASVGNNVTLVADQYFVCLFYGDGWIGYFNPGYIMVVDTESKSVKYVAIGSNPARGISY